MNTLTIARKELNSYFRSPIAYGVMAFFALIAGYLFYVAVMFFVRRGMEGAMMGQSFPMDMGDMIIRPLFSNISVIGLFLIPVTLMMHKFWTVTDPTMAQIQMIMFMKNVSMLGGALLISQFGAGPFSLEGRRSS